MCRLVHTFPCLTALDLAYVRLGQAEALSALRSLSHLTSLQLYKCRMDDSAVASSAQMLQGLSGLRQLWLDSMPSSLAAGLTQLTGLQLPFRHATETFSSAVEVILGLPQLLTLELGNSHVETGHALDPQLLSQLLTTCSLLQDLTLGGRLDQQGLDAVLTLGTHLTSLRTNRVLTAHSTARSMCTLKALQWFSSNNIQEYIRLPLAAVEQLEVVHDIETSDLDPCLSSSRLPESYNSWWLPLMAEDVGEQALPSIVHKAALSLASCPAWQAAQPKPALAVYTAEDAAAEYGDATRGKLLAALQPLAVGVTHIILSMQHFQLGQPEVAALGQICGSTLTHLTVVFGDVDSSFWPAIWAHLPALTTLSIAGRVILWDVAAADITAFCSYAPRPLTLELHHVLHDQLQGSKLQEVCRLWGKQQVTLRRQTQFQGLLDVDLPPPLLI
jgi:hypothetical protein